METAVIMKRKLFDREISQNSKTGFFSATDLVNAGNLWRLTNGKEMFKLATWKNSKATKEFTEDLEKQYGEVYKASRGKNGNTWVHPYLFIDIALAISPKLKIEVYSWIMDELVKHRNASGDSYKKMSGALYLNSKNKRDFPHDIQKIAKEIKLACHVKDWEHATEAQLKTRDKIHENISLLCDVLKDNDQAVKIAILKTVKEIN